MNCEVPGCTGPRWKEDVCGSHAGDTYKKVERCGYLVRGNPDRPCVSPKGHLRAQHTDATQYERRLKGARVNQRHQRDTLYNDGVIDWLAIDLAVEGDRIPRMSWVERDIAAGILLSQGFDPPEIRGRLGINQDPKRWGRIEEIANVIRREGYHARY